MNSIAILLVFTVTQLSYSKESVKWDKDLSNEITIGISTGGFTQAVLECSADWMAFVISLESKFEGVLYTRGSFYLKESPCFKKANGEKDLALKIPYNECGGKRDSSEGGFVNTVIVQHDNDLIMPGDLAFKLVCKDERIVNATLDGTKTQISLVDPDPAVQSKEEGTFSAKSYGNIATLKPITKSQVREEL